ncbi:MAG: hypothetical protein JWR88_2327, partial [Pseudonocardia sp.]|nr:hypothetical protein [Pseudonocardia sp.]
GSLAAVRDLGAAAPVLLADQAGAVLEVLTAGALES